MQVRVDDKILKHLRLILLRNEVELPTHFQNLREQLEGQRLQFIPLTIRSFRIVEHLVYAEWNNRLKMVFRSQTFRFECERGIMFQPVKDSRFGVSVRTDRNSVIHVTYPHSRVKLNYVRRNVEFFARHHDISVFQTVTAFHWRFPVRLFCNHISEELPKIKVDFQPFVISFCLPCLLSVFFGLFFGLCLVCHGFEFGYVLLGVMFERECSGFGARDFTNSRVQPCFSVLRLRNVQNLHFSFPFLPVIRFPLLRACMLSVVCPLFFAVVRAGCV